MIFSENRYPLFGVTLEHRHRADDAVDVLVPTGISMAIGAVATRNAARRGLQRKPRTVAHYRRARRPLRTPASHRSRIGLDWTNFFIADVQTGFGTFVAFYLAELGWSQSQVGLALGIGGLAGVLGQIPGGALADAVTWKRGLVALGILMIGAAALILALAPIPFLVFAAEILHGMTAGLVSPAIAGINLGLVGRRAMSLRTGRNFGFAAAGTALTAALLGIVGSFVAPSAIFLAAAGMCARALIALSFIRGDEIDYARARNAHPGEWARELHRVIDLARNRNLLAFAACLVLFQFANASALPLVGESLAAGKATGSILVSGLIIVPQILVAVLAPWVGYLSEVNGRKPLLLVGLGVEAIRIALFAVASGYPVLVVAQTLDGIGGSIINVLTVLVITDITTGTGRFNLAQGAVGALIGMTAATSTGITGFVFQAFGQRTGFVAIAAVAALAAVLAWRFVPETKPGRYLD
jgi:predicted MFS family arabinose efflux permease